ncbi:MAG: chitobiase/beta-hexosaminidase C-terminal domain-containing protein [Spirochaetes bacterium]|nr:chitobiase/beta-hexosaminidase C-terminal domain-containing protein [Spirochaetota bacterium]
MRFPKSFLVILLSGACFAFGCDGCYDNDMSNYVCPPEFSHVRGTNYLIQMSSSTDGAVIKYTVDGSDPKTSSTAVEGASVTIDFLTEIKAFAAKDEMIDSKVVSYRMPAVSRTANVKYNSIGNVEYYTYSELDGNENKVIEVKYAGKGDDLTWFTNDDIIAEYTVFEYSGEAATGDFVYTSPGTDGEWITSDDVIANYHTYDNNTSGKPVTKTKYNTSDEKLAYWTYEYSDDDLSYLREYDADDTLIIMTGYTYNDDSTINVISDYDTSDETTVLSHLLYDYPTSGVLSSVTEKLDSFSAPGDTVSYLTYQYDNIEEYSTCQYDASDNLTSVTKFKGYGTDTEFEITDYTYDGSGNVLTKSDYEDVNKTSCRLYTEYSYSSGSPQSAVCYTGPSKDEKLYTFNYTYTNGRLTKKEKVDSDDTTLLEYTEYDYNTDSKKIKETTYTHPDADSLEIAFNLEVSAGYIDGGYYYAGGANFSHEGVELSTIINIDPEMADFVNEVIDRLESIYDNLEITNNGVIITGSKAGNITITVRVSEDDVITVKYCFNGYDDGDILADGKIIKTLQGTIDLTGNLSGSLNGSVAGSITVTDANPSWIADNFSTASYTVFEYNGSSGLLEISKHYSDPGADGDWGTADDNLALLKTFTYDGSNNLTDEYFYTGSGTDETWGTPDDEADYHLLYTITGSTVNKIEKYREYGTYMIFFNDDGDDDTWETIAGNGIGYSVLEFPELDETVEE